MAAASSSSAAHPPGRGPPRVSSSSSSSSSTPGGRGNFSNARERYATVFDNFTMLVPEINYPHGTPPRALFEANLDNMFNHLDFVYDHFAAELYPEKWNEEKGVKGHIAVGDESYIDDDEDMEVRYINKSYAEIRQMYLINKERGKGYAALSRLPSAWFAAADAMLEDARVGGDTMYDIDGLIAVLLSWHFDDASPTSKTLPWGHRFRPELVIPYLVFLLRKELEIYDEELRKIRKEEKAALEVRQKEAEDTMSEQEQDPDEIWREVHAIFIHRYQAATVKYERMDFILGAFQRINVISAGPFFVTPDTEEGDLILIQSRYEVYEEDRKTLAVRLAVRLSDDTQWVLDADVAPFVSQYLSKKGSFGHRKDSTYRPIKQRQAWKKPSLLA